MTTENNIVRYDGQASERTKIIAWRDMFQELWTSRELIHRLVVRNIQGQYRQSFLGYLWIALPPLATAFVFTMLRQANIVNVPMSSVGMPYALFALIGTTLWQFFTQVTMMVTASISGAGGLVKKIYFPREVLALSALGNALMNLVVRCGVIVITFACFRYVPHWQIVYIPVLLLPLVAFGLGLGLLFAPVNAMMHDMNRMLSFAFQFGMFLAPTVYPTPDPSSVSSSWQWWLYILHGINPVSHYIHAIDALIETGTIMWDAGLLYAVLISILSLLVGWRFFHMSEPFLAERI